MADALVVEVGEAPSTGGRPPAVLGFNHDAGVVLVADLGATHSRIAVSDLAGHALAEERRDVAIAEGPDVVLSWVEREFDAMLDGLGRSAAPVSMGNVGPDYLLERFLSGAEKDRVERHHTWFGSLTPERHAESRELMAALEKAIARVKPNYREILLLRFREGLAYRDIADVVGLPMGTVKIQLHRARKHLARELERLGHAPSARSRTKQESRGRRRVSTREAE